MHESIEEKKRRRRREAVRGVALFALLQAACVAGFAALCWIPDLPKWLFWIFAALAALCVVPVLMALVALRQRFKEIEGGELDAASQY
jgi:fatty acid desaturase